MLNWIKNKFKKPNKPIERPIAAGSSKTSTPDSSQDLYSPYNPLSPTYIGLSSGSISSESSPSCSSSDSYSSSSSSSSDY
jgi:hypothetical protein